MSKVKSAPLGPITASPRFKVGQIVETTDQGYGRITYAWAIATWNADGSTSLEIRYCLKNGETTWSEIGPDIARVISEVSQ